MPNWCSNTLVVIGPKPDRDRFYQENAGLPGDEGKFCSSNVEKLSFSRSLPIPEKFLSQLISRHWTYDKILVNEKKLDPR